MKNYVMALALLILVSTAGCLPLAIAGVGLIVAGGVYELNDDDETAKKLDGMADDIIDILNDDDAIWGINKEGKRVRVSPKKEE